MWCNPSQMGVRDVVFIYSFIYHYFFYLESPLGLGVRLESKVGGYPSDEITCWRLTPVVYIFFRSSEGHLLARPERRGPEQPTILRQVDRTP
jgi:hypothetical protein